MFCFPILDKQAKIMTGSKHNRRGIIVEAKATVTLSTVTFVSNNKEHYRCGQRQVG